MGNSSSKPSQGKTSKAGKPKKSKNSNASTDARSTVKPLGSSKKEQGSKSKSSAGAPASAPAPQSIETDSKKVNESSTEQATSEVPTINVTNDLDSFDVKPSKLRSRNSTTSTHTVHSKNSAKDTETNNKENVSRIPVHQRHHSLGHIPLRVNNSNDNPAEKHLNLQNHNHPYAGSKRLSISRRSSYNSNVDLPPSMVQVEPKSPILKGYTKSSHGNSVHSLSYNESAVASDDGNDTPGPHESSRKLNRSASYASSTMSGSNTVYNTPLNSPGIEGHKGTEDYFGSDVDTSRLPNSDNTYGSHHSHHQRSNSDMLDNTISMIKDVFPSSLSFEDVNKEPYDNETDNASFIGMKKKKPLKPIDIDETIQKLLDAGYAAKRTKNVCLKNSEIAQICQLSREIFLAQPPLLELSPPVKIVGDVHGQYGDLLRLFTKCGFPPAANYLFLGDYVDRGKQSLETILLLLCYKIKYPENFFLLRGNHECANVTRVYGFYDECKRRCNIKTWKVFVDTFNTLPLAAIVTGKIFCVHGGLSPVLNSMDEIRHVSRPTDVPDFGLINDLLWSDPADSPNEWEDNERGVSYCYNKVAINKFLNKFGFDLVCRAHMVVEDGYEFFNDRSLVTVFSAPNYCGEFDNWGAVMTVSEGLLCSFELLDPLDSAALKQVMKKGRQERKLANQQQYLE